MGLLSSKQTTKGVSQSMIDPNVYSSLWGAGAVQPRFNKKGQIKNQAEIDAANAAGASGGGVLGQAQQLQASNPSGLNETQTAALGQMTNYLTSPEALAGQQAMQSAATKLMGSSAPAITPVAGSPADVVGNPIDWNSIRQGYQADLSKYQGMLPGAVSAPDPIAAASMSAGSAGGLGIDYKDAMNRALSGEVNNPYLTDMAKNAADLATQNWMRTVMPALSSGARMSGMYGSSRQGVAQGIAAGDLNRAITDASTNLFGNAYETAQNRSANAASQLAGYDAQAQIANAQMAQAASLANAQMAQQAGMFNSQMAQQAALANQAAGLQGANMLMNYDLGAQGLGLQAGNQQANYDLGLRGLGLQQQGLGLQEQGLGLDAAKLNSANLLAGAGLAQQASGIPLANLQALYGVGQTMQSAPWQNLQNYANLLYPQTNTGAAQTQSQTTTSTPSALQAGLGIASTALGAMSGLGALGGVAGGLGGSAGMMDDWTRSLVGL